MCKSILILSTRNKLVLEEISIILIKKKIASCISIFKNIKFIRNYHKKLCKEKEYRLFIKIKRNNFFNIKKYINFYEKFCMVKIYYE